MTESPTETLMAQVILDPQGLIIHSDSECLSLFPVLGEWAPKTPFRKLLQEYSSDWLDQYEIAQSTDTKKYSLEHSGDSLPYPKLWIQESPDSAGKCLSIVATKEPAQQMPGLEDILKNPELITQMYLKLQRSEKRLDSYIRHFPGVFFNQRRDFSFSYLSPNCKKLLGLNPQKLAKSGSQFLSLLMSKDRDFFVRELKRNSAQSKAFTIQYRIKRASDDSLVYLTDVRTPVFSDSGMILGYEGVWLDTTRQFVAELKLTSTAWKENQAMLTSGLVHDFSNVMAGIYALSELYHSSLHESNHMYEGLGQIKKSSMEARKLVRRIIDINREEAGQKGYHDVEKLITDQLDLLKIIFPRGTEIDLQMTGQELPVYIDDVEFRQILLNLAMNAKDALVDNGKITISTSIVNKGETIFKNCMKGPRKAARNGIIIQFQDNGTGIQDTHIDKIFNSFFTTKEIHKGSGFGLYNIQRIIRELNGIIDFATEVGKGTSFHIFLNEATFTEDDKSTPEELISPAKVAPKRCQTVVYSTHDVSGFDLISMLYAKHWEVMLARSFTELQTYLYGLKQSPEIAIIYDFDDSDSIRDICTYIKDQHPETSLAIVPIGTSPHISDYEAIKEISLICDNSMSPQTMVQNLEKLTSLPVA